MNPPEEPVGALALALPAELHRRATDVAAICREIVKSTAVEIQGRNYVKVEGWMSIATAHGCTASARDVEMVESGCRAIGEIRRIDNGQVIATAEGFVGKDEPVWFGGVTQTSRGPKTHEKRPEYAIRAMTQTRAISRACRTAFAHVVVMMDAGLSTTPAEEVPMGGFNDSRTSEDTKKVAPPTREPESRPAETDNATADWQRFIVPKFVKDFAGQTLGYMADENPKSLVWWAENYEPKPYQGKISPVDIAFQKALHQAADEIQGPRRA